MIQLVYEPLDVQTVAADGTLAASWDVSASPVLYGQTHNVTVYRNGVAAEPSTVNVTGDLKTVTFTPETGYPLGLGEQIWGAYPAAIVSEPDTDRGRLAPQIIAAGGADSCTWDTTAIPVHMDYTAFVIVYRNGVAAHPSEVAVGTGGNSVTYTPDPAYPLLESEKVWGSYPAVFDTTGTPAGRRILDWDKAMARLVRLCPPTVHPTLNAVEMAEILEANALARVWQPGKAYQRWDKVVPPVPTGLVYTPARNRGGSTFGGTSGAEEPVWPLHLRWPAGRWDGYFLDDFPINRREVEDGTLRWEVFGVEGVALWDIERAAHQAWNLKAAKASGEYPTSVTGFSTHPEKVIENCLRMAERYRPMGIA